MLLLADTVHTAVS